MAGRIPLVVLFAAPSLALSLWAGGACAEDENFTHTGMVTNRVTSAPITAEVAAFPADTRTKAKGACEVDDEPPLATATTRENGMFDLTIPATMTSYAAVFCADDFYPANQPRLRNTAKGQPVTPVPTALWPHDLPTDPNGDYGDAVLDAAMSAANDLAYLQSLDPKAFANALAQFVDKTHSENPNAAKALQLLGDAAVLWNGDPEQSVSALRFSIDPPVLNYLLHSTEPIALSVQPELVSLPR